MLGQQRNGSTDLRRGRQPEGYGRERPQTQPSVPVAEPWFLNRHSDHIHSFVASFRVSNPRPGNPRCYYLYFWTQIALKDGVLGGWQNGYIRRLPNLVSGLLVGSRNWMLVITETPTNQVLRSPKLTPRNSTPCSLRAFEARTFTAIGV